MIRTLLFIALLAGIFAASPVAAQAQLTSPAAETESADSQQKSVDEAIDTLLTVIEDEDARNALIERLQTVESQPATDAQAAAEGEEDASLARRLADGTTGAVQTIYESGSRAWRDLTGLGKLFSTLSEEKQTRIRETWLPLLGTIITTTVLLLLLNPLSSRFIHPRLFPRSRYKIVNIAVAIIVNLVSDVVALMLAYAGGYALAIAMSGGLLAVEQSLYLNAFLVAGFFRMAVRLFVRSDRPDRTILDLHASVQASAQRWLTLISGILVYGLSFVVPVTVVWTSYLVGRSFRVIVTTLAVVLALIAIRRIAHLMNSEWRSSASAEEGTPGEGDLDDTAPLPFWYKVWPVLATIYVLVSYVIALVYPALMAELIGVATAKTVAAGVVLALAIRTLASAGELRLRMPRWMSKALPSFDDKINSIMPTVGRVVAIVFILAAIVYLLDGWQIVDVETWFGRERLLGVGGRIFSAFLIVVGVVLAWAVIASWIDTRLSLDLQGRHVTARTRTLLSLFKNAITVVAVIFGLMMALSELGINIAPLIAGAGVIGLAVGFGAQKLVQDIITGVFIQIENAFNEGDVVTVAGTTGVVEKLTIRSVGVRDLDGIYHIVPFSAVDTVSNFMRLFSYHVAVVGVAYKESVPAAKDAMEEAFRRLKEGEHAKEIIDEFEMHGVVALADSSVNIRARIKTLPGSQWAVGRAYTELVKEVFDERDIEIPFPHRTIFQGTLKPSTTETATTVAAPTGPDIIPPSDEEA